MSSDEQNIHDVEYSDDSDYEHRDSVLSTGHRNSVANRNSVVNRQSKRMSYGRKDHEHKIEEVLNRVEEEATATFHQTQSHIINSNIKSPDNQKPQQQQQANTQQKPTVNQEQTTQHAESSTITNEGLMFVSMNESENKSEVFEVMEMSQSMGSQMFQSMNQSYKEGEVRRELNAEQAKDNERKPSEEGLDYLPEQPYQETHRQEQPVIVEQVTEATLQTAEQTQPQTYKQQQQPQQQDQEHPQQQHQQPSQPQQTQQPQQSLQQEPRSRSASNQSQQQYRKPSSQLIPDQINQYQGHSLGDEFNNQEEENDGDEIVQSFRDSTEEKRRNRIPGNSELEYGDEIHLEDQGNITYAQEQYHGENQDDKQQNTQKHHGHEQNHGKDHHEQQEHQQRDREPQIHQQQDKNETQKNGEIQIQVSYQSRNQQAQESVHEIVTQNSEAQKIEHIQLDQQEPEQKEAEYQVQAPHQEEPQHIITSQELDLPEYHHKQPKQQDSIKHEAQQEESPQHEEIHQKQQEEIMPQTAQYQQPQHHHEPVEIQASQPIQSKLTHQEEHNQHEPQQQTQSEAKQVEPLHTEQKKQQLQQANEEQWPATYGQQSQQQNQPQKTEHQPKDQQLPEVQANNQQLTEVEVNPSQPQQQRQQPRHEQIESIVSQPHQIESSSQQQEEPTVNQLDQRIPTDNYYRQSIQSGPQSKILPTSQILHSQHSSQSQPKQSQGLTSIISHTTQRQSHQLSESQSPQQSTVFQRFSGIETDFSKNNPSQVVQSQIRESYSNQAEVSQLKSQREPSSIIYEQDYEGGLQQSMKESMQEHQDAVGHHKNEDQHADEQEQHNVNEQAEVEVHVQNVTKSEFIKIEQANSSFAQSQSNARYIQSQVPPQPIHQTEPTLSPLPQPINIMTRVESSQYLPEPKSTQSPSTQKKDIQASEYFVVDKNLSSLDIYGRSEYNQLVQQAQVGSQQTLSERETIQPHPLKSQLMKEAQKLKEAPPIEEGAREARKSSAPQPVQPQQAPKLEEPQQSIRNSVSNAQIIQSTTQMATAKKAKKQKAGSKHQAPVQNPESCKCLIF